MKYINKGDHQYIIEIMLFYLLYFKILKNEIRSKETFEVNIKLKPEDNFELTEEIKRNKLYQMFKREE